MGARWFASSSTKNTNSCDDTECTDECVKIVGNEVYFYGDVNQQNVLTLNTELRRLENEILSSCSEYTYCDPPGITIYINTEGGDIFAGLSAMDHIWNMRLHVTTVADGHCASAGTFILLGGHNRAIRAHSFVLIHQISSEFWGTFQDCKDETKAMAKFMKTLKDMYSSYTNLPEKKIKSLMTRNIYMDANECVKYGVVNEIL